MATQEVATGPMAIVDKMYACFGTGDMETIKNEVFAPDIQSLQLSISSQSKCPPPSDLSLGLSWTR